MRTKKLGLGLVVIATVGGGVANAAAKPVLEVQRQSDSATVAKGSKAYGSVGFSGEYEEAGHTIRPFCRVTARGKLTTNLRPTDSAVFSSSTSACDTPGFSITGQIKKMTFSASGDSTLTFKAKPLYSEPNGCKYELPASYPEGKVFMEEMVGYPGPSPVGTLAASSTGTECPATVFEPAEYPVGGETGSWRGIVKP